MRPVAALATALLAALLVGCAGTSGGGAHRDRDDRDGPGIDPPADVDRRPDAEPRVEDVRPGGANKPYQVFGRDYVPLAADSPLVERGLASWYGRKFHGRPTASGERYDMYAMTAAHPTLPIPSYARIRNPANGREVVVRVNDRGPFHPGRIVDLSYAAAAKLGVLRGVAPVELQRITWDEIRADSWRREPGLAVATTVPADAVVPISATSAAAPTEPAVASFWVQIGAFRDASGAASFQRRVTVEIEAMAAKVTTVADVQLYRVQVGPYPSRDEAAQAAARIRAAIGVVPLIVEKAAPR